MKRCVYCGKLLLFGMNKKMGGYVFHYKDGKKNEYLLCKKCGKKHIEEQSKAIRSYFKGRKFR